MTKTGEFPSTVGVIFDLDGTLVDTLEDITTAINRTCAHFELPPRSLSQIRAIIGEGLTNLIRRTSGMDDPAVVEQLVQRYRMIYRDHLLDRTRLYPRVAGMLDALAARGIPMCVLSNKPHEFTQPICDALLSRWGFLDCRGARDEVRRKPDPTVALALAERMGCRPEKTIFVGDSPTDVDTAGNAGMIAVAVTWGYRDRDELQRAGPAYLVDSPAAVADAVLEQFTRFAGDERV